MTRKRLRLKSPQIYKVLDVSTCHITDQDRIKLDIHAHDAMSPVYELHDYGWLVYAHETSGWPHDRLSPELRKILEAARELGCDYVRLDRDGSIYQELRTFAW